MSRSPTHIHITYGYEYCIRMSGLSFITQTINLNTVVIKKRSSYIFYYNTVVNFVCVHIYFKFYKSACLHY